MGSSILRHQYQYDRRGLLTTVGVSHATTGSFSQILTLDYAIDGAVTERYLGTGTGQTSVPYAYDVAGRIHTIGDVTSTTDPFAALYSYTPSGLIALMDTRSGAAAQNCPFSTEVCSDRWTYTFSYDGLARLTGATYMPVPPFISSGSQFTVSNISYDPQGNIETLTRNAPTTGNPYGAPVDNLTYTYTARTNRLESVADAVTTDLDWDAKSQIPFAGPSTFQYNRVGSMTQMTETLTSTSFRETEVQRYNERQLPEELQIRLFVAPGGMVEATQVSYRYDANGQRISKHVRPAPVIGGDPPRAGSIVQERYVRDGMRLIGVFDENNELKSWNIGGAAGLVGRAIPDPRAFQPVPLYYMTDHLGSIRAVVNASGTVVEGRDYYPYGLTMSGRFYVAADTTHEGYTGHELDPETGMYCAGARYYGPALARWFVPDPLADAYPAWSPFTYSLGNPLSFIDPDGQFSTHTDSTGTVIAIYNDGDRGVYRHADLGANDASVVATRCGDTNSTSGGGELMGYTETWSEFAQRYGVEAELNVLDSMTQSYEPLPAQIKFGLRWDAVLLGLNRTARRSDPLNVALASRSGEYYDIKSSSTYGSDGRLLGDYYVSSRSAGNYLAGMNARSIGVEFDTFQRIAGGLHRAGTEGVIRSALGREYGPPPMYGEVEIQYRYSYRGYHRGLISTENENLYICHNCGSIGFNHDVYL